MREQSRILNGSSVTPHAGNTGKKELFIRDGDNLVFTFVLVS